MKILAQNISTHEVRTVLKHSLMDTVALKRTSFDAIDPQADEMPVGSVEFVSKYMELVGINKPIFDCYPIELKAFISRSIYPMYANEALQWGKDCFVKPSKLKLFNGFIRRLDGEYDEHDQEQFNILKSNPDEFVFVSDVVKFQSEWRYYINQAEIIGNGRYDPDGEDDAPEPDLNIVKEAVELMFKAGYNYYTLDFGVLENGKTELVEANDAWAIGLYDNALSSSQYTNWLINRWQEIDNR